MLPVHLPLQTAAKGRAVAAADTAADIDTGSTEALAAAAAGAAAAAEAGMS